MLQKRDVENYAIGLQTKPEPHHELDKFVAWWRVKQVKPSTLSYSIA